MFVYEPLQNNSECTPFEEAITEPQEEEQPKTLLEVRDTVLKKKMLQLMLISLNVMFIIKIFVITRCIKIR